MFWCGTVACAVTVASLCIGYALDLPGWSAGVLFSSLRHISTTALLAIALCPPVFLVASAGRGYLAALGFVIMSVVVAQIIGALGFGAWVPWAVPALYSGLGSETGGALTVYSYGLVALTGMGGLIGTACWWRYADQAK
jgi:ABC-2 type transport system permease protein